MGVRARRGRYTIALPGTSRQLDILDGTSTAIQRALRRSGLAGYEPETAAALLSLFEISDPDFVFYDIGANVGLYSALCAALFQPSSVVAFEPTPDTAAVAREIFRANQLDVDVVEAAIGSITGRGQLYVSAVSDVSNSLVRGFKADRGSVLVDIVTIDDEVSCGRVAPHVIKVDVETAEPDVIRGAHDTIQVHRPTLVLEVLNRRGFDHGPSVEGALEADGYSFYRLGPDARVDEFEAIRTSPETAACDWLLSPTPLRPAFHESFQRWHSLLAECTADRNGRVPLVPTIQYLARSYTFRDWREAIARRIGARRVGRTRSGERLDDS